MPNEAPTNAELIRSLKSTTCPGCGNTKKARRSVCFTCWRAMDKETARALYTPWGAGYAQAFNKAMGELGVDPVIPPAFR